MSFNSKKFADQQGVESTKAFEHPVRESLQMRRRIDRICGDFVDAWNGEAKRPKIEDYLSLVESSDRSELLQELLLEELYLRQKIGESIEKDEYLARFPTLKESVDRVFARSALEHDDIKRVGRYDIVKRIGRGAAGTVYLASDSKMNRRVAIKLARRDRFGSDQALKIFLEEAEATAALEHKRIVTIHDIASDSDNVYLVEKYVDGGNLGALVEGDSPADDEIARIVKQLAEGVGHAHQQGWIHRDLKPANVLLDRKGDVHIADFGLAIKLSRRLRHRGELAGTPAYMSPEQVRGETHRLNGQTDLWSIGVMMYQLLTGQLPFTGDTEDELFDAIQSTPLVPPRQISPERNVRLQNICMRCLEKRTSNRYFSAQDLLDEIKVWRSTPKTSDVPAAIVPKGLRSFDAGDSEFFLKLLPGPRDRDGIPDAIRFWKQAIEDQSSDSVFPAGVLCGPSGSGKSSLFKAGLIPRLAPHVQPVFIECSYEDTEVRILKALQQRFSTRDPFKDLPSWMAAIREGQGILDGSKLVLVLDQFEQWLNSHSQPGCTQLLAALRQCDGLRVQVVFIVREDFWASFNRFSDELEVPIRAGWNYCFLQRFDLVHAAQVLTDFGVAYGRLTSELSSSQGRFVEQAVRELAINDQVIPVHLALFAEMFQDKPWTPEALKGIGGAKGIGVRFLEEKFSSATSPIRYRQLQPIVEAILSALTPSRGQDLRGSSKNRDVLREVVAQQATDAQFDEALTILERELRLIVSIDPDTGFSRDSVNSDDLTGVDSTDPSDNDSDHGEVDTISKSRHLQLTHDFLVRPIREWRERRLRESSRGRARIRLRELVESYAHVPEPRNLPSGGEFIYWSAILASTSLTQDERDLMRRARRKHAKTAVKFGLVIFVLMIISGALVVYRTNHARHDAAERLVNDLLNDQSDRLLPIIREMKTSRERVEPILIDAESSDLSDIERARVVLAQAALRIGETRQADLAAFLTDHRVKANEHIAHCLVVRENDLDLTSLLKRVLTDSSEEPEKRLRAACAIAQLEPKNPIEAELANLIVSWLLREPVTEVRDWTKSLRPYGEKLLGPSLRALASTEQGDNAQSLVQMVTEFSKDTEGIDAFCALVPTSNDVQFVALMQTLSESPKRSLERLKQDFITRRGQIGSSLDDDQANEIANLALACLELGDAGPMIQCISLDSLPGIRAHSVNVMNSSRTSIALLRQLYTAENLDRDARFTMLLAFAQYAPSITDADDRLALTAIAREEYLTDNDSGIHSASELILRRLEINDWKELHDALRAQTTSPDRQWMVDSFGQTFAVVEVQEERSPRRIEVCTTELTYEAWRLFLESEGLPLATGDESAGEDLPVEGVPLNLVKRFCIWLSEKGGIDEDQHCYKLDAATQQLVLVPNAIEKQGYRLPTVDEWIAVCRAGEDSKHFFGNGELLLESYAWCFENSLAQGKPAGSLLPNRFGVFDTYGNALEVCFRDTGLESSLPSTGREVTYLLKGFSRRVSKSSFNWEYELAINPQQVISFQGIRIVRSHSFED